MGALYTFWGAKISYRTESVHFLGAYELSSYKIDIRSGKQEGAHDLGLSAGRKLQGVGSLQQNLLDITFPPANRIATDCLKNPPKKRVYIYIYIHTYILCMYIHICIYKLLLHIRAMQRFSCLLSGGVLEQRVESQKLPCACTQWQCMSATAA